VRFTTYEKIERMPIVVIKRDKSRQPFEREKILKGLLQACAKRPVSRSVLENIIDKIEFQLANTLESEVSSDRIGEMVLEHLKSVDEVAYVRFASVYRDFDNIDNFMKELWALKKR
jgi:transcriptional repressor NrdR